MPSPRRSAVVALSALIFLWSFSARSENGAPAPVPPPVYSDCTKLPRPSAWKEQERWVWDRICAGEIADLQLHAYASAGSAEGANWPAARDIGLEFLKTILLSEPYRSAVPPAGVRIAHARFRDSVDLSHASMIRDLWLTDSYFDKDVIVRGSHIPGALSFVGSHFTAGLDLYESRIDGDLNMSEVDVQADVNLQGAAVGGSVDLTSATVSGNLIMEVMQDNNTLFASGMHVGTRDAAGKVSGGQVNLHAAQIKGNAEFTDAQVEDTLYMTKIAIGRDLLLTGHGKFADIDLAGGWVGGDAELTNATIEKELHMYRLHVERDLKMDNLDAHGYVTLQSATTGGYLSLSSAHVAGDLNMDTLQDSGDLFADGLQVTGNDLRGDYSQGRVLLYAAQIKGDATFDGARVESVLDMTGIVVGRDLGLIGEGKYARIYLDEAHIGGSLEIKQGEFTQPIRAINATLGIELRIRYSPRIYKDLDLTGLRTGGSVRIESGTFGGRLLMNDAAIGQELRIGPASKDSIQSPLFPIEFDDSVEIKRARILGNARIGSALLRFANNQTAREMTQASRENTPMGANMPIMIDMQGIQVGGELLLGQKAKFEALVNLAFAHIAGNLDLTEGFFRGIDLTGATIDSEIRLGSPQQQPASWQPPEMLNLRNVSAGTLQDLPGETYWPGVLDLDGFAYGRLGGSRTASGVLAERSEEAFEGWLNRQAKPSPQSYIQLAQVLRASGFGDKADAILYAGKKREMQQATGGRKFFLMLEYLVTGFGIYPLRALYSIGGLVLLGTVIFGFDGYKLWRRFKIGDWVIYSLDMLLPVVHLREKNNEWEPHFWMARYYLYLHRLIGFLLASVIIASLTHGTIELHG